MRNRLSVGELNRYAASLIGHDDLLSDLLVEGELSGAKRYPSGHFYFSLKDSEATVSCVMFRRDVSAEVLTLKDGDHLVVGARAGLYERDGRFQLYVHSLRKSGVGDLWQQFEALKRELEAAGYFRPESKKSLPLLPKTIGVVSSEAAAVLRDIVHVLRRRFPGFTLRLISVHVQGDGAAMEIARAIDQFNALRAADVLIVARGGGSMEDLNAFNHRLVADAIFRSTIPVISAVGHETDFTIADFVADLRAPTPSAAAELVMPLKSEILRSYAEIGARLQDSARQRFRYECERNRQLARRLSRLIDEKLRSENLRLDLLRSSPLLSSAGQSLLLRRNELQRMEERLSRAWRLRLRDSIYENTRMLEKLNLLSPFQILERGYFVARDLDGNLLRGVSRIQSGQKIDLQSSDGQLRVEVLERKIKVKES